MTEQNFSGHTITGTLGGTLAIIFINISLTQFLQTAILAAIGAAVSFLTSYFLQRWLSKK